MPKRVVTGTVTSAATAKTRRVEVPRIVLSSDHDTANAHSTKIVSIHEETSNVRDLFA